MKVLVRVLIYKPEWGRGAETRYVTEITINLAIKIQWRAAKDRYD